MESPQKELDKVKNPWKLFMKPGFNPRMRRKQSSGMFFNFLCGVDYPKKYQDFQNGGSLPPKY